MNFSQEEKETIILLDDSVNEWDIYTMQRKIMTKLDKIGVKPYKTLADENNEIYACYYKIPYKQLSFRKLIELSEEEKEKRRNNLINNTKNNS